MAHKRLVSSLWFSSSGVTLLRGFILRTGTIKQKPSRAGRLLLEGYQFFLAMASFGIATSSFLAFLLSVNAKPALFTEIRATVALLYKVKKYFVRPSSTIS